MSDTFDRSAILGSFLEEVSSYLPEIQANLDRLQQQPEQMALIEETYRRTHTIAGSAAMMDFAALSRVALGMEDLLGDAVDRQVPLDAPALALLRRSFGRLGRLVENIRTGAPDEAVLAEDEADRAASRGAGSLGGNGAAGSVGPHPHPAADPAAVPQGPDWLAAFAAPPAPGSSGAFPAPGAPYPAASPVDSHPFGNSDAGQRLTPALGPFAASLADQPTNRVPGVSPMGASPAGSAEPSLDEMLQAFQVSGGGGVPSGPFSPMPTQPPAPFGQSQPNAPVTPPAPPFSPPTGAPPDIASVTTGRVPAVRGEGSAAPASAAPGSPATLDDLRAEAESLARQVASLADLAVAMRQAAQTMEGERAELRGFLDGSRDAIDRLEEWTGRQMGLDLRGSPESVRRYLPLSVIWVISTRLKSLVALLNNTGRGVTIKQEELEEALRALRAAVDAAGHIYHGIAATGANPGGGFSATVAQVAWAPPAATAGEVPGVPGAPSAPAEPPLSVAQRAELERNVREQLRRELEDEVRAEVAAEVRRDEEDRLRTELQIQVRREILSQVQQSASLFGAPVAPVSGERGGVLPVLPSSAERAPKPVQVTTDVSPEALDVFRDEAQEHLQTITAGVTRLEQAGGDMEALQSVRRAMHTLKGAAGMMGFVSIQQLAHASEDLLDRLMARDAAPTRDEINLLLDTSETLDQMVAHLSDPAMQQRLASDLIPRYGGVTGFTEPSLAPQPAADVVTIAPADEGDETREQSGGDSSADLSVRLQLSKLDELVTLFGELLMNRSIMEERVERLGRMVSETVVVSDRLRDVGSQLETRFEASSLPSGRNAPGGFGPSPANGAGGGWLGAPPANGGRMLPNGKPYAPDFDELELDRYTEFHRLSRGLAEGVADITSLGHEMETIIREAQTTFLRESRLTSDFQDRLLKARLVPLQSLVPRLYRAVRATAVREGKEIEFFSEGTETEVDRKVAEDVAGPLMHIVRNAVGHAIERPAERERAGKPRAGRIVLSATYEGNQVVIAVRDDGAGIDAEKIRQTAIARGWIDGYTQLSDHDAINLIFQPGVSTADTVTEESGRGVGLDVVRDTVTRLRGTIEVDSAIGQGTTFTMKFPISLQISRAVLVQVNEQIMAIPMAVVDQIGRLDYYQRSDDPTPAIDLRGERYPLAQLASYLRMPPGPVDGRASVLLVNAGKRRVALLVDAVVAQQEVVLKPLGPHLRDVRGVAGAAVLGNGQVVLILELHELLAQAPYTPVVLPPLGARAEAAASSLPAPQSGGGGLASGLLGAISGAVAAVTRRDAAGPRVAGGLHARVSGGPVVQGAGYLLVVDDSPSVRRVVGNMLKANGWEVQTARDGIEALEIIAQRPPAAVLLDIEMPRMDGYELLATVRSQEQYRDLPLIVLTSRAATKHQQRALQLGADAYVIKPYRDEDLLSTIAGLVQGRRGQPVGG
jgi:chemotaxis protein histidine kinase CheA/ActR/RegA family two-component response regulator